MHQRVCSGTVDIVLTGKHNNSEAAAAVAAAAAALTGET